MLMTPLFRIYLIFGIGLLTFNNDAKPSRLDGSGLNSNSESSVSEAPCRSLIEPELALRLFDELDCLSVEFSPSN